jgi:hypothetical protein
VAGLQALQRYVRVAQFDLGRRQTPTSPDTWFSWDGKSCEKS